MGVMRRNWRRPKPARAAAMAGLAVVAGGALVACDPGGLSSATAAYTTSTTAKAELNRRHVDVSWLSCTGRGGSTPGKTPSSTEHTVVSVDCDGRTRDGRKITVTGKVTKAVDGACVRGALTARVGGRQVFHVGGLGNCNARPGPSYKPSYTNPPPGGPRPTVTVTVTRTLWCKSDPTCWPAQGK
ncbi:hypothetical protein [Streptomyces sp. NK08204]|uniref:hypothetical protein n=1 Tax=Streptomyces sp. NK08204 TaxID=2873260 RepID=UPI001CEDCC8E|nr:hypothetical protein [Streptomyces sp. NK08204]